MNNYKNAFTEVYKILEYLEKTEYKKIPTKVIDTISQNKNTEYCYELKEGIKLREQLMLPETKAILFNLFRDYLSTPEQKEKIIRIQKEERMRNEIEKKALYDTNVFKAKKKIRIKSRRK